MTHFLFAILLAAQEPMTPEKIAPVQPPAAAIKNMPEMRSSLLIEPKSRAQDYVQAFELLRKERPTAKINIQTSNGLFANIAELSAADNGTLMLVKIPYSQGMKFLIIPLEDIQEVAYSP